MNDFEDYTEKEVQLIFFEACKRGKLNFIDFFMNNKELKFNINLKRDGYEGLELALDNQQDEVVAYLLKYKEVTTDSEFNFDTIFRLACTEDNTKILKVLVNFAEESGIANTYNYKEAFSCLCRSGSVNNIKFFLSHKPIANQISNEYLLEKFDEATRDSNEKLVDFFLNSNEFNFKINSNYYFFKLSGFNPYYQRVKIDKGVLPVVRNYDLENALPIQMAPKKRLKI